MASTSTPSSSSTTRPVKEYHVFLSFRGEDTRNTFTSHLYRALVRESIDTFIDNRLKQGDEISSTLLSTIEKSMISVVIFSERYANSGWCLKELAKIVECEEGKHQDVIPVFFHVQPADVRRQTGRFGEGFVQLKSRGEQEMHQSWTDALRTVANLAGFVLDANTDEAAIVEKIVRRILDILSSSSDDYNNDLVGVDSSIKEVESLLEIESKEKFSMVGLWGMTGIGKTTIAEAVFKKIKNQFDYRKFFPDISQTSASKREIDSPLRKGLRSRQRVLIALDDVTDVQHVTDYIGDLQTNLGSGSRIIITTRDKTVLERCKRYTENIHIYEVKGLRDAEARKLFRRSVFGLSHPNPVYDLELLKRVVKYASGVPFALKDMGDYLSGLGTDDWESAIDKQRNSISIEKIREKLNPSYGELDVNQKCIFLDIAFFLKCENIDILKSLVAARFNPGYNPDLDINVLINKCLISIVDNKIVMKDLLQTMGKEEVRQKASYPEDRSRLCHEDIIEVLRKKKGTDKIEGLCLNMSKIEETKLSDRSGAPFATMTSLKFFKLHNSCCEGGNINKIKGFEGLNSDTLIQLCWYGCPLKPSSRKFQQENLVVLDMPHSNFEKLSIDQLFVNLKHINLSNSKGLKKITNLRGSPNLKSLILEGCTRLVEISSSGELKMLVMLNLRHCEKLKRLPNNWELISLEDLHLLGCSGLDKNSLNDVLHKITHAEARTRQTLCISFPGTGAENPEWFDFLNPGSSVAFGEPDDSLTQNVVSFALCAIVDYGNYQYEDQCMAVGYDLKAGSDLFRRGTLRRWENGRGPCYADSDQAFLGSEFRVPVHREMTVEFYVADLNGRRINTWQVKSCGFRPLRYQDVGNPSDGVVNREQENNNEPQHNERIPEISLQGNGAATRQHRNQHVEAPTPTFRFDSIEEAASLRHGVNTRRPRHRPKKISKIFCFQ